MWNPGPASLKIYCHIISIHIFWRNIIIVALNDLALFCLVQYTQIWGLSNCSCGFSIVIGMELCVCSVLSHSLNLSLAMPLAINLWDASHVLQLSLRPIPCASVCYPMLLSSLTAFPCSFAGLLGPSAASMAGSAQNSLLNALNSSISPLQTSTSTAPSPTLWSSSLTSPSSTTGRHTHACRDTYTHKHTHYSSLSSPSIITYKHTQTHTHSDVKSRRTLRQGLCVYNGSLPV